MARFYIAPALWEPEALELVGAEAHHCLDVMRMKVGDLARVFNGLGAEAQVQIAVAKRDRVEFTRLGLTQSEAPACRITLGQAIPKGKNMELIIEKATELGVSAVVPLLTSRTVVQLDGAEALRKQEKWQRGAVEAAKQCGQNWLPAVHTPESLSAYFAQKPAFDLMLVGSLEADARHLKTVLARFAPGQIANVLVLVGPEGDFSPSEMQLIKSAGCAPISFGKIILRTETAAFYCLSVLSHELRQSAEG
jgi:16S rRNA (uracil1498-N3)-methyltransferase